MHNEVVGKIYFTRTIFLARAFRWNMAFGLCLTFLRKENNEFDSYLTKELVCLKVQHYIIYTGVFYSFVRLII